MDCFYAAIEVRDNPSLKGKPVAVGGSPTGRGVVATANYEARKFGVRSALSSAIAIKKCPDLNFVRPNFRKYKEDSQKIRSVFKRYTDIIEPLSLDEAYLDVTDNQEFNGSATLLAQQIRREIFEDTELTASAGIAPNKFLAKVASDWKKPNGQFTIAPKDISNFVKDLNVRKIPGVGKVTAAKMYAKGINTCADLQEYSIEELTKMYGKWGKRLYYVSRGEDDRPVAVSGERKSLSIENTFFEDLRDAKECQEKLPELFGELKRRLERAKVEDEKIKGLFVKVKFHDFQTTTLDTAELKAPDLELFKILTKRAWERGKRPVRLLGIGVRLKTRAESQPVETPQLTFPF